MGTPISLVLSSGGARGLAHIGAIRALVAADFDIQYVSGSSMGALVGGIYAAGRLDDYAEWARELDRTDMVQLLDIGWGAGGLFKGDRLIAALRELVGEHLIEEMAIGYTAVATDLHRQREVWINEGPLFAAIRASIAIPLVFAPVTMNNRLLIDGAVANPLPIAPTLNDATDLIVAIDVNGAEQRSPLRARDQEAEETEPEESSSGFSAFIDKVWPIKAEARDEIGMLDVAMQAMDVMQTNIAGHKLSAYSPDVIVQVPRNTAQFFEFDRADEIITIGRERTEAALAGMSG